MFQPPEKKVKVNALQDLFAEEDKEVMIIKVDKAKTIPERVRREISEYKEETPLISSTDISMWWFTSSNRYPILSTIAQRYLCMQASSTPSERVFSTAGDTISAERARIQPEKANQLIFLNKNAE